MKKLLSLLSILTISGSAIPTAIAASTYQKEKKLNSDFIYKQTNNLENLIRNKRQNNNQNIIGISEVVITTNGDVYSSGLTLNNKVYFGSYDRSVYEYDPATEQQKVFITTNAGVRSSGSALNNKVYFGSTDGKVYEYDPATEQQKVVINTNSSIHSSGVVLNNKLYIGSIDGKVYEYDPATEQQKVVINTNSSIHSSGVVLNNKLYISSGDGKVYEYDPATEQQKVVINTIGNSVYYSGVVLNNKLYFGCNDGKVYEYDPIISEQKIVTNMIAGVVTSGIALNNKLYFGCNDGKVYEYDPVTNTQKVVITTNAGVRSYGVVLNNKLYFGCNDGKVYEYDPVTNTQKVVITTNGDVYSSGVVLNNKLYIGSVDGNVYEYDPLELIESTVINMREQIKRGVYLYYKKQNPNFEIKLISNINLDNIVLSDVIISQEQKNKTLNLENEVNICPSSSSWFINNSNSEQTQYTISCSKQLIETNTIQKMNGFSKSESTANNDNWTAKWGGKFTFKAKGSAGVPLVTKGEVEAGFEVSHENSWGKSRTETISDTSNSSDTEINTTTETMTITLPSQPVKIPSQSKILASFDSWKNNIELILNTSQKVEGIVSAKFIDKNNNKIKVSITIKDAMISLSENNILPSKIKINDDDSINFLYDNKIKREIIMYQTEIGKAIPLSSYEKNVIFKDNTTSLIVLKS